MTRGVVYFLYGNKHPVQLVVSLYSLLKVWDGPVTVLCAHDEFNDTSLRTAARIKADSQFDQVDTKPCDFLKSGKRNNGYANKTLLQELSPYESTVFIDADTLVVSRFDEVFPLANEVVLTEFAQWRSNNGRVATRVGHWKHCAPLEVERQLGKSYPAINTGVMGFTKQTVFMRPWREMTLRNISFICDEIAAQLIFLDYPHRILDHRWNASVVYSLSDHKVKGDARIWHGHGGKFFRKGSGRRIWRPWYEAALKQNAAQLREWTPYRTEQDFRRGLRCTP